MAASKQILLVEDDKFIALALKIRLEAEGFTVHTVLSKKQALCSASEQLSDIALIDFNLPDGNGIDLMQEMLQMSQDHPFTPIIMTASKKPGLREKALAHGAYEFFEKPFKSSDLIESIQAIEFNERQHRMQAD